MVSSNTNIENDHDSECVHRHSCSSVAAMGFPNSTNGLESLVAGSLQSVKFLLCLDLFATKY